MIYASFDRKENSKKILMRRINFRSTSVFLRECKRNLYIIVHTGNGVNYWLEMISIINFKNFPLLPVKDQRCKYMSSWKWRMNISPQTIIKFYSNHHPSSHIKTRKIPQEFHDSFISIARMRLTEVIIYHRNSDAHETNQSQIHKKWYGKY